jgi:hypothetical protein
MTGTDAAFTLLTSISLSPIMTARVGSGKADHTRRVTRVRLCPGDVSRPAIALK